ncbi:MAG: abortive infection family protein [Actinomycetota bacterium]
MSGGEIQRIVNRYIGVAGGYLGDFTYASHAEFYPVYCDLDIDPGSYEGTTRARFIQILSVQPPPDQARIIRRVIERFPAREGPPTRTAEMRDELLRLADRCDGHMVQSRLPVAVTQVVSRAIADAETLLRASGATSGVDRVHTALHGYLIALCAAEEIVVSPGATMAAILKALRRDHPRLQDLGPRAKDIERILNSCGTIMDALDPVRNRASVAHPNELLLASEEAALVINTARTLLSYLSSKLA